MSNRHHNFFEDGAVCFWTSSIIEHKPALRSPTAAKCLLEVIDDYRRRYGVRLLGYMVMPEHVHLLLWAQRADTIEKFLEQLLRHVFAKIAGMTERAAERGRAYPVVDEATLLQKMEYILCFGTAFRPEVNLCAYA